MTGRNTCLDDKMISDRGSFMNVFDNNEIIVRIYKKSFIKNFSIFVNEFVIKIVYTQ